MYNACARCARGAQVKRRIPKNHSLAEILKVKVVSSIACNLRSVPFASVSCRVFVRVIRVCGSSLLVVACRRGLVCVLSSYSPASFSRRRTTWGSPPSRGLLRAQNHHRFFCPYNIQKTPTHNESNENVSELLMDKADTTTHGRREGVHMQKPPPHAIMHAIIQTRHTTARQQTTHHHPCTACTNKILLNISTLCLFATCAVCSFAMVFAFARLSAPRHATRRVNYKSLNLRKIVHALPFARRESPAVECGDGGHVCKIPSDVCMYKPNTK